MQIKTVRGSVLVQHHIQSIQLWPYGPREKKTCEFQMNPSGVKWLTHDSVSGGFWNGIKRNHGNNLRPDFCFNSLFPRPLDHFCSLLKSCVYKKRSPTSLISTPHICQSMLCWVTVSNGTKHQQGRGIARSALPAHSFSLDVRQSWLTLLTAVWHYG